MTSYLVSALEPGSWRIGIGELVKLLKREWPELVILVGEPDEHREVYFEGNTKYGYVFGFLQPEGNTVVVEMVDDMRAIVSIAIWFRSIVPADIPLLLFNESYTREFPVTPSTTEDELASKFLAER